MSEPGTTTQPSLAGRIGPGLVGALVAAAVLIPAMLFLAPNDGPTDTEITGYLAEQEPRVERRSEEVIDLLMNYDADTLDEVADQMLGVSTGNFREQYEEIIGKGLNEALSEASASSEGRILQGPQVSFSSASQAIVLAGVEQTTRSDQNPDGRTFSYLLRLTMIRNGPEWKADRIEIISGQAV
jgi:hypothetical protein